MPPKERDPRLGKVVMAHVGKAIRDPASNEFYVIAVDDNDFTKCYVLLRNMIGDHDEWVGGYFLFRIEMPDRFPFEPPSFYAMHDNGVYGVEVKCCISIGEFHKSDYKAVLGISGFINELANGMMCWEFTTEKGGISLLRDPIHKKKKYSAESWEFLHEKFPNEMKLLHSAYNEYSKKWDLTNVPNELRQKLVFPEFEQDLEITEALAKSKLIK